MYMKFADLSPWTEFKLLVNLLEGKAAEAGRAKRGSYTQKDLQHECREIKSRIIELGEMLAA